MAIFLGKKIYHNALQNKHYLCSTKRLKKFHIHRDNVLLLPNGESIKTRRYKEKIENWLIEKGCDKSSQLVAIGGGALLDVTGFVAVRPQSGPNRAPLRHIGLNG